MEEKRERGRLTAALGVNTASFALGGLAGLFLARWLLDREFLLLSGWLESFEAGISTLTYGDIFLWAVLWDALRWPLMVWLLGFTAHGVWMIPVMFALRGFSLCFSAAALSGAVWGGFWLALILLGGNGLITLPAFFCLGVSGQRRAEGRDGQGRVAYLRRGLLALGCAAGCAGLEFWLFPVILKRILPLLTGQG